MPWPPRLRWLLKIAVFKRFVSGPRIKIWRSAFVTIASFKSIERVMSSATQRVFTRNIGVSPERIPDYLALVGDASDGYPGISGIGSKGAAGLIDRFGRIEDFPDEILGELNRWHSFSRDWQRCGKMPRCFRRSTRSGGRVRARILLRSR